MAEHIIFYLLSAVIVVFSIMAVTSKRLIRSATYLLFVLLAVAGWYLILDYEYLFAVQTAVYAGGVMVLFIFAILLTQKPGESIPKEPLSQRIWGLLLSVAGVLFCGTIIFQNISRVYEIAKHTEIDTHLLGTTLMGTGKYEYLLPFEAISVLLLASVVGAIMIARKRS